MFIRARSCEVNAQARMSSMRTAKVASDTASPSGRVAGSPSPRSIVRRQVRRRLPRGRGSATDNAPQGPRDSALGWLACRIPLDELERRAPMRDIEELKAVLAKARVDPAVFELRPDYRALLLAVDGILPGAGDQGYDVLVREAEAAARAVLQEQSAEEVPQVAAWREAYRAFGAKPQRTRNSLEALLRRGPSGLPRVNRLTDIYNATSVLHLLPIGGEDLTGYVGAPRLIRAGGTEPFDTVVD